jgi:NAD(P)-dependent dehydrogenase (short-subunit alcohol dehydrogenase family)
MRDLAESHFRHRHRTGEIFVQFWFVRALLHDQNSEKKRLVGEAVPYGRMGTPDDYRGIAVFLASQDSDYIVAQTFNVDGGNWMS